MNATVRFSFFMAVFMPFIYEHCKNFFDGEHGHKCGDH